MCMPCLMPRATASSLMLLSTLCALVVLCLSCGAAPQDINLQQWSSLAQSGQVTAPDADLISGLPELPRDHEASQLVETLIQGKASLERSAAASENGPALLLDGEAAGGYQWALYGFSPAPDSSLDSVNVLLDVPDGKRIWLALADYGAGRWKLFGPYSDSKTLLADDPAYLSPGGNLYVVALVDDGQTATVNALSVRTINPANSAPTAALEADVLSGDAPLDVSFDASASSDSDGTIIEYAWDWDGDGGYDSISDAPLLSHIFTSPGIQDVKLRVTDEYFARSSASVQINVTAAGNNPPNAVLGGGLTGTAPLLVLLDAGLSDSGDAGDNIVRYDWDFNNDQVYEEQGAAPTVQHVYESPGTYKARVRITDSAGNQDLSNFVSISVNAPPLAQIEISPGSVQQGVAVDLFGGQSSDSDNGIVKYEWDTDGNGSFDKDSGFSNSVTVSFDVPGVYNLSLRVTDGAGAVDTASGTLAVHGWTSPVYPDPATAGTGNESSLAVVGGLPAIAYYEAVNTDLFYVRALDGKGLAWNSPVRVNSVQSDATGRWPSMKLVGGNPAVAFHDSGNGDLMYCRSSDNFGVSWPASLVVDSAGDTGQHPSMQVVDGLPHIAYHQLENLQLRYVRASDSLGGAWDASFVLDDSGDVGAYPSLAVINGNPAVSYWDDGGGAVVYMRANTPGGTSWGAPVFVGGVGSLNSPTWLLEANGNPAVGYEDNSSGEQWLSRSSDAQGMGWPAASEMPAANGSPASLSMAIIDGNPAIAFFDNTGFDLEYSRALNKSGTQWEAPQTVDTQGVVGGFSSMTEVNGGVGISYYDSTFSKLKFVWGY